MKKKSKTPWPTKDAMTQIYEKQLWGGDSHDFYSGAGSHHLDIVEPYIEAVTNFLKSKKSNLSVCDLGCGDFNIGQQLVPYTSKYIAVDIVEDLIERNKTLFEAHNLEFRCLDIANDELPIADCAILRQVLQHLSNAEIKRIVKGLSRYQYIILTEHLPVGDFEPNVDIISGQGIRLKHNSGVDVLKTPFNLKVKEERILSELDLGKTKGRIVTILYQLF
ncbi:class I SAM-dependent methyltransferase [Winogradskyella sp.]|uniref:class I SAM-dependent methyltransferase n=1 Tax=Winogradskyella sp. TaxID=1883156 RepID=UPI003BAC8AD2